jgi:predicted phosphodiesterase
VHGGDVCDAGVLEKLRAIAPVTAVRGNNDRGAWAAGLRESELVRLGDVFLYAIHDLAEIDIEPHAAACRWWYPGTRTVRRSRSATACST